MSTPAPARPKPFRVPPALVGAGVLALAIGFGLPKLTPGAAPDPVPREPGGSRVPPPDPMPAPDATGVGASLLKLAVGLVVVCGACVAVARWIGPKPVPVAGAMEVVASIAVAQCVLHLVRAGDRRLLVGTDLGGVKTVLELPAEPPLGPEPDAAADALPPEADPVPMAAPVPTPPPPPAAAPPLSPGEIRTLMYRLRARTDARPPA